MSEGSLAKDLRLTTLKSVNRGVGSAHNDGLSMIVSRSVNRWITMMGDDYPRKLTTGGLE